MDNFWPLATLYFNSNYSAVKPLAAHVHDENMTSRERVLKAINFEQPDRPPVMVTLTPQAAEKLSHHLGLPYEEPVASLLSTRISHQKLLTRLGNDCVCFAACYPPDRMPVVREDGKIVNEWGMVFKDIGLYSEFAEFPLAHANSPKDILDYPFPDPNDSRRYQFAAQTVKEYGRSHAIIGELETTIFETAWYLVGLEKLLMDMAERKPYVDVLFDRILEINITIGKKLIELGADIIWAGDDFGTQDGLIMSPATWRHYFKPRISRLFQAFRTTRSDIKIAWHSCGSVVPLIPEFIELGLDILNPIQPLARGMDPVFLKKEYGGRLCFFGGIDIQNLLPHGTPDQIRAEVKRISGILGAGGGFILAPAHNIQDDTPVENIMAFFTAATS